MVAWVANPSLSESDLAGTFWTFGRLDEPPRSTFLALAPAGLIGNHVSESEDLWQVIDGRLLFISDCGIPTIRFDLAEFADNTIVALAGCGLGHEASNYQELRRTCHPVHPLHPTPPDAKRRAIFLHALERPRRPNLVILRAGRSSLHPTWIKNLADMERNWDLCISYYDEELSQAVEGCEYLTHQPEQRKFQAIHDLFFTDSPLWKYDQVWMPDDDLATSWGDINRMFHLNRALGLDLAQPSLSNRPDCFVSHAVTLQQPGSVLRYVNFVEIMCPLFSRRALRLCLGTFRDSRSGWGLDFLWPRLLGGPRARVAIIDAVAVIHTRAVGFGYDVHEANAEMHAMLRSYQCALHMAPILPINQQ